MEKYTIQQELGQGAFGKVYKAEREEDGSTHALKCLTVDSPEKGDVVLKELRALQQVGEHPNILPYTEVFTDTGLNTAALDVWLVLDYCTGGTMDSFISSHKADRATVLQLLCDTAEGVTYLHDRNVVHGALKPDNILVDTSGQRPVAKIADFGLVRVYEKGGWDVNSYHRQDANGTRMYLSPEIIGPLMEQQPNIVRYTAEADVFAMGLIMAAILQLDPTTDPAVPSKNPAVPDTDLADPVTDPAKPGKLVPTLYINEKPTAVAEVMIAHPGFPVADMLMTSEPPGSPVKALVLAMLAADPHQRPTSEQVLGRLRQITSDGTVMKTPPSLPPKAPHIVVEVPAESSDNQTAAGCCAACWRCDSGHSWYSCKGKGWGWLILLIIMYLSLFALWVFFFIFMGLADRAEEAAEATQAINDEVERRNKKQAVSSTSLRTPTE